MNKINRFVLLLLLTVLVFMTVGCARQQQDNEIALTEIQRRYNTKTTKNTLPIPVLMYHHFTEKESSSTDTIVSSKMFEEQMKALRDAEYVAVTPEELCAFANGTGELPENPILITMDDGYTSNLTIAAPILEKYSMKATIFSIGVYEGKEISPHTNEPMDIPRFPLEAAKPWIDKGVITVSTHTYDMHQRKEHKISGRNGVLQKPGESEEDYRKALRADIQSAKDQLYKKLGVTPCALAFPYGLNSKIAVEEWENAGVRLTLTTVYGCSTITRGDVTSTRCLKRWNITDEVTKAKLLQRLHEFKTANS